jgi:hypothetical protein
MMSEMFPEETLAQVEEINERDVQAEQIRQQRKADEAKF